jgi:hypothetical protein
VLYRARNVRLPPSNLATWWDTTKMAGRGTFAAALSLCVFIGFGDNIWQSIYLGMLSFFDKAGTWEKYMPAGGLSHVFVIKYYYIFAIPFMLLAVLWSKRWPPAVRDPVSAVMLCNIQMAALWQGAFTASNLYGWLGGPDGSTLGCQILIEVIMLLLYLYARTMARKAFGAAPTYEARALFMYLLLSDVFAEVNVRKAARAFH